MQFFCFCLFFVFSSCTLNVVVVDLSHSLFEPINMPGLPFVDKSFQGCCGQGLQNKKLADDDAPSAPPLAGSVQEVNQVEELLNFRGSRTPCPESSSSSTITDEANVAKRVSLGSTMDGSTANRISDRHLRYVLIFLNGV